MFNVAWDLFKSPLLWVMLACLLGGTGYVAWVEFKERGR
jgi:hypothetical protein